MAEKIGFIKLYRSLLDDDLWNSDEPFSIRDAFIDLLLRANHKNASVYDRPVSRGQHWTSLRKLATRWHMDRRTVKKKLDLMQLDGKIYYDLTAKGILITVINYSKWQGVVLEDTTKSTTECATKSTSTSTIECTQTRMSKNDIKNDKEKEAPPPFSGFFGDGERE